MDGNKRGAFPTGSSGGGGKRGYGVRNFYPRANSDDVNSGGESSGNKNNKEKEDLDETKEIKILIDPEEAELQFNDIRNPQYRPLPVFDNLREPTPNPTRQDTGESVGEARPQDVMGNPSYMGMPVNNYQNIPRYGHQPTNQGAPVHVQEHRAQANAFRNERRPPMAEPWNRQNDEYAAGHGRQVGGQEVGLQLLQQLPLNNLPIIHYTLNTLLAYLNCNETLADCLSLRDSHILNFINTSQHLPYIFSICLNNLLAQAMENHIKVVRALMIKDLQSAVYHQCVVVNSLNALLAAPLERGEQWAEHVMRTSLYELRVVMDKQEEERHQAVGEVRWSFEHVEYCMTIGECHCRISAIVWTRRWYRR